MSIGQLLKRAARTIKIKSKVIKTIQNNSSISTHSTTSAPKPKKTASEQAWENVKKGNVLQQNLSKPAPSFSDKQTAEALKARIKMKSAVKQLQEANRQKKISDWQKQRPKNLTGSHLTNEDVIKAQNVARHPMVMQKSIVKGFGRVAPGFGERVRKQSEKFVNDAPHVAGFLESSAPFVPTGSLRKTTENAYGKMDVDKAYKSKRFLAGSMVGMGLQYATTGGVGAGAIQKGLMASRGLKAGKLGHQIASRAGADAIAGLPINISDAAGRSKNAKEFAKHLAVNTLLDVGVGGAMGLPAAKKAARAVVPKGANPEKWAKLPEKDKRHILKVLNKSGATDTLHAPKSPKVSNIDKAQKPAVNGAYPLKNGGSAADMLAGQPDTVKRAVAKTLQKKERAEKIIEKQMAIRQAPDNVDNDMPLRAIQEKYGRELEAQKTKVAQDLFHKATPVQAKLNKITKELSDELGFVHADTPQKSVDSILSKIERKNDASKINDLARGKIEVNDFSEIPTVLNKLKQKGVNFDVKVPSNEWGYKGFHLKIKDLDGVNAELQITRGDVWKIKEQSDLIYAKWRDVPVDEMTPQQTEAYKRDLEKSRNLWNQTDLSDFDKYVANSSSESTSPSQISAPYMGADALTHSPLDNSRYPVSNSSTIRPSSKREAITPPPSKSSIAQEGLYGNTKTDNNSWDKSQNIAEAWKEAQKTGTYPGGTPTHIKGEKVQKGIDTIMRSDMSEEAKNIAKQDVMAGEMNFQSRKHGDLLACSIKKIDFLIFY